MSFSRGFCVPLSVERWSDWRFFLSWIFLGILRPDWCHWLYAWIGCVLHDGRSTVKNASFIARDSWQAGCLRDVGSLMTAMTHFNIETREGYQRSGRAGSGQFEGRVHQAGGRALIPKNAFGCPSLRVCFLQGWGLLYLFPILIFRFITSIFQFHAGA